MCGIFGYINNKDLNDDLVLRSISKRGPDNQSMIEIHDTFKGKKCKFFHSRLSIIDTSLRSNQPLFDNNSNFVITYNGELYNYRELRKELISNGCVFRTESDTEVVLNAYKIWGEKCLNRFRGMFAFCILNKHENTLFIARDPYGMKPLYYLYDNETFVFSSLLSSILKSGAKAKFTLDNFALNDYISTGSFIPPDTIVNKIKVLLPGNYLIFKNNRITI